jgi:hypothetical protein
MNHCIFKVASEDIFLQYCRWQHYDESYLEGFDKCPEEGSNPLVFVEQFD